MTDVPRIEQRTQGGVLNSRFRGRFVRRRDEQEEALASFHGDAAVFGARQVEEGVDQVVTFSFLCGGRRRGGGIRWRRDEAVWS